MLMEKILEDRQFSIGPFSPKTIECANAEYLINEKKRDDEFNREYAQYEAQIAENPKAELEVPTKGHVTLPRTFGKKKLGIISAIRKLVDRHLNQAKGPNGESFLPKYKLGSISIVLEEAIVNAIIHGARYDAGKQVLIYLRVKEDVVGTWRKIQTLLRIVDPGTGFDSSLVPDPTTVENITKKTGRGLAMMAKLMEADFSGNEVRLSQSWEQDYKQKDQQ